ncbi:hypothetical protein DSM43518_04753 [Mycobacterium marinum]|uniref:Uncharacterized protein n=5 Tax=Mycobacterium ulcerans group TaxID=2993898 RepID=A0A3E2MWA1_MYCMR|nr:hypothetical secreted protein [Mycobacterium ulcerans Agy99]ACC42284.1 hypothetical secreted protein [Mycobacterium marinum M]AGC63720.1 putative secreted protein [Mycobacterium liflandii 128FXT]AXN45873.1 hypothetical protein MM1218R_03945 [Mycobacterium marinum]EPQ46587.1 secreted protein [Mycobacterium sp. 012931]EPQ74727.1 putative secreted protein [Mycobacterium marinum str. Europe]EPQ77635.1 putative secreted protein [Mycobacterium marinum MB2]QYL30292.1 hypothetical protein TM48_04
MTFQILTLTLVTADLGLLLALYCLITASSANEAPFLRSSIALHPV